MTHFMCHGGAQDHMLFNSKFFGEGFDAWIEDISRAELRAFQQGSSQRMVTEVWQFPAHDVQPEITGSRGTTARFSRLLIQGAAGGAGQPFDLYARYAKNVRCLPGSAR